MVRTLCSLLLLSFLMPEKLSGLEHGRQAASVKLEPVER